jgi:hypothetical protein
LFVRLPVGRAEIFFRPIERSLGITSVILKRWPELLKALGVVYIGQSRSPRRAPQSFIIDFDRKTNRH